MLRDSRRFFRRGEKGQDIVEFALILPILLLLIMGIVDFGRAYNTWMMVTHGAREGARYAAVGYSNSEIEDRIRETTPNLTVAVSISPGDRTGYQSGEPVTVGVTTEFELITGIIAEFFTENPFPLSSTAEMRYEGPKIP